MIAWFPKAFTPGCTKECESLGIESALCSDRSKYATSARAWTRLKPTGALPRHWGSIIRFSAIPIGRPRGRTGDRQAGFPSRWTFYIAGMVVFEIDKHVRVTTHGTDVAARLTELAARGTVPTSHQTTVGRAAGKA